MVREDICTLKIAGMVENIEPYGVEDFEVADYTAGFVLLLSRDRLQSEIQNTASGHLLYSDIYISTDTPDEIDKAVEGNLKALGDSSLSHISGENLFQEKEENEALSHLIKYLLYVFEIIIIIFCMLNIFYIISASTTFRTKDFAVLKSIGMSEKQIDKMLVLEGFFYGFSGLVFGTVFSFAILKAVGHFAIDRELYLFKLPFASIIYAMVMVYAVIALAMMSVRKKAQFGNIIDDVKTINL